MQKHYVVEVNGVIVGTIPSDRVAAMAKDVRWDWRTWVYQTRNVASAVYSFMRLSIYMLVVMCVVGTLLIGIFDAPTITTLLQDMSRSPAAVEQAAVHVLYTWMSINVIVLFCAILKVETFGLNDQFMIALAMKLRQELSIPADGNVQWWPASGVSGVRVSHAD